MTPGPTPAPPEVLAAIAQPVIHHRGPDYKKLYARVPRAACGRSSAPSRRCCSSEAPARARWSRRSRTSARPASPCWWFRRATSASAGPRSPGPTAPRSTTCATPGARFRRRTRPRPACASAKRAPSSSRTPRPRPASSPIPSPSPPPRREAGALSVIDAISSLGAVPLETDAWGIDVVASGAQKALMTPPGLAMVSASPAAWEKAASAASPRYYWDWEITRKGQSDPRRPVTPPVSLVAGLNVALGMLLEEGLESAFERHIRLGRACREGLKAMGLELSSPDDDSSAVVTAARAPDGIDSDELALLLRDRHGVTLAPGPGRAQGQDLPHRPHRLLRRVRHHDRARGRRARARRAGRRDPARRRRHPRARGLRAHAV